MEDVMPKIKRNTPSVEEIKEMDRIRSLGIDAKDSDIFVSNKLEVVEPQQVEESDSEDSTESEDENAETQPISSVPPELNKEASSESTFCPEPPNEKPKRRYKQYGRRKGEKQYLKDERGEYVLNYYGEKIPLTDRDWETS